MKKYKEYKFTEKKYAKLYNDNYSAILFKTSQTTWL